ncbi:glycosyl transferase [Nocardioides gansuensis]|uniref:Glycosyl transferase n=1 Tax=Nocardioides gansuensis TaxID=2138300 RepID=A0A2T8F9M7_9ACTN|nr:glycosyltransferase family 9 protein [Nocardioides gansuensis]PVG82426.1 glycosyl transferase [Nocardioides gansuensis]
MPVALVLRALGLGDLLVAVPALRALRRALPGHEIVLATPRTLAGLATATGAVDRVHDMRGLGDLGWPGPPPDVAVNLHGSGPESHDALTATRPRRLAAFGEPATGSPGPRWDPDEHEVRRWCRLVSDCFDVEADPQDGLLEPPVRVAGDGTAVVHPGAASPARRWPPGRFAEVARRLAAEGRRVLLTGSADEVDLCREVARTAGLPRESVAAGTTSTDSLAALVAAADVVLSGDTGVAHLAAAYDRPAVALYGPTPPTTWAPLWGRTRVLWHGTGAGDPHAAETDPALASITVDEAWAAVVSQLGGQVPRGTSAPCAPAPR